MSERIHIIEWCERFGTYLETFIDSETVWDVPFGSFVHVIRCKDCKFNEWCGWLGQFRTDDDYCSRAERREEDV